MEYFNMDTIMGDDFKGYWISVWYDVTETLNKYFLRLRVNTIMFLTLIIKTE